VSRRGAVLATSRRQSLSMQNFDDAVEICQFSPDEGANLLLHLLPRREHYKQQFAAAVDLSKKLGGHALAVNQMAAFINARSMSIREFLALYEKSPNKLHRQKKEGWKSLSYNHAIDTIWKLSFDALSSSAKQILGVLCLVAPESIPEKLFAISDEDVSDELAFIRNDDRSVLMFSSSMETH
jgi:hypothetical protein